MKIILKYFKISYFDKKKLFIIKKENNVVEQYVYLSSIDSMESLDWRNICK